MAIKFTAQDLRTLRLLSRTSLVFSTPFAFQSFSLRLVRGGESITPINRIQRRKVIQSFPKKINSELCCDVVVRYGSPERDSRIFRSPALEPIKWIIKGQTFLVDISVTSKQTITSVQIQQFVNELNTLFKEKVFSLNQTKADMGSSLRAFFVTRPSISNNCLEQSAFFIRPFSNSFSVCIEDVDISLVNVLKTAVQNSTSVVRVLPKRITKTVRSTLNSSSYSILNLLSYRISQLSKK